MCRVWNSGFRGHSIGTDFTIAIGKVTGRSRTNDVVGERRARANDCQEHWAASVNQKIIEERWVKFPE